MQGYEITDLSRSTQKLIKEQNLDTNGDGLINEENGELANLLSASGVKDINELRYDSWFDEKKEDLSVAGIMGAGSAALGWGAKRAAFKVSMQNVKSDASKFFEKLNPARPQIQTVEPFIPLNEDVASMIEKNDMYQWFKKQGAEKEAEELATDIKETHKNRIERHAKNYAQYLKEVTENNDRAKNWKPSVSMRECIEKALKKNKTIALKRLPFVGMCSLLSLLGAGVAVYMLLRKANNDKLVLKGESDQQQEVTPNIQTNEWQEKYQNAFGEDAKLKEYTPQKGEYWISILKAKYGVDDETAQKMANKIKEMIYDDPMAAKQSPVMYLPEAWTFEGKTYTFNEATQPAKTEKYSDEVKTEMGKMSKDIKYQK